MEPPHVVDKKKAPGGELRKLEGAIARRNRIRHTSRERMLKTGTAAAQQTSAWQRGID